MIAADKRIHKAIGWAKRGQNQKAIEALAKIVKRDKSHLDAHFFLGTFLCESGQFEKGLRALERACELEPTSFQSWMNRGIALRNIGRLEEARSALKTSIDLNPEMPGVFSEYAKCLIALGQFPEAVAACDTVLRADPEDLTALLVRGRAERLTGNAEAAYETLSRVLEKMPDNIECLSEIANLCAAADQIDQAAGFFERILEIDPKNEAVQFALSTLAGEAIDKMPDSQTTRLFDGMAVNFEQHLMRLGCQIPDNLAAMIPDGKYACLDLGCGTGWLGRLIKDKCHRLVGVDLSPRMIEQADKTQLYDELAVGEIVEFMRKREERFSLITASDVFIYTGKLEAIFGAVANCLTPEGLFAFSIEPLEKGTYIAQTTGRFAHSDSYIGELARDHGFAIRNHRLEKGRKEKGEWLHLAYYLLEKTQLS